jgi:hypothetical protein
MDVCGANIVCCVLSGGLVRGSVPDIINSDNERAGGVEAQIEVWEELAKRCNPHRSSEHEHLRRASAPAGHPRQR